MNNSPILKRPDYLVCTCMEVMYSTIVESIHKGDDSFQKLSDSLGVGTGCSSCVAEVYAILEEEINRK
jgi:assimilatory nitrate reductase catalytic subunit